MITLPLNWALTTLDQVACWGAGGTPSRRNPEFFCGNIPWLKSGELGHKYVRSSEEQISEEAVLSSSAKIFPKGSVAIAMYGATMGSTAILGVDAATNQACAVAECFPGILNEYLYYYLIAQQHRFVDAGKGGAQPNISQTILKGWSICLPPTSEQRRIVAKIEQLFSELDKGVEALTTAREQLKVYRQSVLKNAFEGRLTENWRKRNPSKASSKSALVDLIEKARTQYFDEQDRKWTLVLEDWSANGQKGMRPSKPERTHKVLPVPAADQARLPKIPESWSYVRLDTLAQIGSGMSVSKDRVLEDSIEVPYLRVANVQRGALDLSQVKLMKIGRTQLHQLCLKKWDVLFNEGGDRDKLGRGWVWEGQIPLCITQNHVFRASPFLCITAHAKFISYWGNLFGQDYFNIEGKQTTNLASINKAVLSAFPIPLLPIDEQTEIIRLIEENQSSCDYLSREIESQLERCAILRHSILKQAFSGQLVPQDPNDEPASVLLERIRAQRRAAAGKKSTRRSKPAMKSRKRE